MSGSHLNNSKENFSLLPFSFSLKKTSYGFQSANLASSTNGA